MPLRKQQQKIKKIFSQHTQKQQQKQSIILYQQQQFQLQLQILLLEFAIEQCRIQSKKEFNANYEKHFQTNSIEQLNQQNFNSFSQHHKQLKDNFSISISPNENTFIKGFKLAKSKTISKCTSLLYCYTKIGGI